jgi:hypothetical protein
MCGSALWHSYKITVLSERRKLLGRAKCRWEDNNKVGLTEVGDVN